MKFILLLLINLSVYADIVRMEDGKCYERKGKLYFIAPCQDESSMKKEDVPAEKKEGCTYSLGGYQLEYQGLSSQRNSTLSCDESFENIKAMNLVYEKALINHKEKIGMLDVKNATGQCNIELYYGDYITIGLMSGDTLMCNDFMVYHSSAGR